MCTSFEQVGDHCLVSFLPAVVALKALQDPSLQIETEALEKLRGCLRILEKVGF